MACGIDDEEVMRFLEEINSNDSEIENNFIEDFEEDDSDADPNYYPPAIQEEDVIYVHNFYKNRKDTAKPLSRFQFMIRLQEQLDEDCTRSRLSNSKLPHKLKKNIEDCLGIKNVIPTQDRPTEEELSTKKRKVCSYCDYKKRRMTKSQCSTCQKHICGEHQIIKCLHCNND